MADYKIRTLTDSSSEDEKRDFNNDNVEKIEMNMYKPINYNDVTSVTVSHKDVFNSNDCQKRPSAIYETKKSDSNPYSSFVSSNKKKQSDSDSDTERPSFGNKTKIHYVQNNYSDTTSECIKQKNKVEVFPNISTRITGSNNEKLLTSGKYENRKSDSYGSNSSDIKKDFNSDSECLLGLGNKRKMLYVQNDSDNFTNNEPKKIKMQVLPNTGESFSIVQKMMKKMGHKEGEGLGKHGQGRTTIVESSLQKGRRGFGFEVKGFESSDVIWDSATEEITVKEEIKWIPEYKEIPLTAKDLQSWMQEGLKKLTIDNESHFCREEILLEVLKCKSIFDKLEPEEMRRARTRSNPFETIRGVFFLNRAAMKMANMDAIFDFMFTCPKTQDGKPVVEKDELLYFADICAGPGGFTEYVLWRKQWDAKGFGFTLKGANDFKLADFFAAPSENFEPHYGVNGIEGDGNVFNADNLKVFRKFVLANTDDKGVHFIMADGGFSVDGQENIQEILSKQLYLCQFMFALGILRIDGHFVCKLFDIFTPFSVGLIYLMYRSFKNVCIHKPNTSRPANSERYIICKWLRSSTKDIFDYLCKINDELNKFGITSNQDIIQVVPLEVIKNDVIFYQYIVNSNEDTAKKQAISLSKIKAFIQNPDLHEDSQSDMRKKSLELWQIPDKPRAAPPKMEPLAKFNDLMKNKDISYFGTEPCELDFKLLNEIKSAYNYCCVVVGGTRCFVLGLGRSQIFTWDGKKKSSWNKLALNMELPKNTLLLAERLKQLKGEAKAQKKVDALHVIDAITLGDTNISDLPYSERIVQCKKFVKAISKLSRPDYAPLRVKDVFSLKKINEIFERLEFKTMKTANRDQKLCFRMDDWYFEPSGVLFYETVNKPWSVCWSKTHSAFYYYNYLKQKSIFECPSESVASFQTCFSNSFVWQWVAGVKIHDRQNEELQGKIHKENIIVLINKLP